MASSMSAKYNIQALGTIPAVEMPCTLTNPHSQSLDWVGSTGNRINIKGYLYITRPGFVLTKTSRMTMIFIS